jgi:hypothetical protein
MAREATARREQESIETARDYGAEEKAAQFENALTELSRKFGIGIVGEPILFVLESDDYDRKYRTDANSKLLFD